MTTAKKTLRVGFDALLAEIDRQALDLRPHPWEGWWAWLNNRWRWIYGCPMCGTRYEGHWQADQICLGIIGELLLAGERVPRRWTHDFERRRTLGHRAWRAKAKR